MLRLGIEIGGLKPHTRLHFIYVYNIWIRCGMNYWQVIFCEEWLEFFPLNWFDRFLKSGICAKLGFEVFIILAGCLEMFPRFFKEYFGAQESLENILLLLLN